MRPICFITEIKNISLSLSDQSTLLAVLIHLLLANVELRTRLRQNSGFESRLMWHLLTSTTRLRIVDNLAYLCGKGDGI
jgi:hypothetical protein